MVICTDGFESFVAQNQLAYLAIGHHADAQVRETFLNAKMPEWLVKILEIYLTQVKYPLSVRLLQPAGRCPVSALRRPV